MCRVGGFALLYGGSFGASCAYFRGYLCVRVGFVHIQRLQVQHRSCHQTSLRPKRRRANLMSHIINYEVKSSDLSEFSDTTESGTPWLEDPQGQSDEGSNTSTVPA